MKQKKELTPEEKKRANKVALFGCLPIIIIGIALIFFAIELILLRIWT